MYIFLAIPIVFELIFAGIPPHIELPLKMKEKMKLLNDEGGIFGIVQKGFRWKIH